MDLKKYLFGCARSYLQPHEYLVTACEPLVEAHGIQFPACMLSRFSRVRFFVTPWTVAYQTPLSMGFSRQEHWRGLHCPPPGDLPDPGIKPVSPAVQADSLPVEPPGKLLVPDQGSNPGRLHGERGVLASGPPGKSLGLVNFYRFIKYLFVPRWKKPGRCSC